MRVGRWAIALTMWLVVPWWSMAQGKLGTIRQEVAGEPTSEEQEHNAENQHSHQQTGYPQHHTRCDDDDNDSSWIFLLPFSRFTTDGVHGRSFPAHPYPLGLPGYMQLDPCDVGYLTGHPGDLLELKPWSVRFSIENGNNFDGLNRFNGTFFGETQIGVGLNTSWNYLYEEFCCGYADDLVLGNITLTWRFLESRRFLARWGLGAWIVGDEYFADAGINFHLSADYFPHQPWVISGLLEGGSLGETSIFHTRISAGWLWKGLEFFGGYDFMKIGRVGLHTPMLGVRAWF